MAAIDVVGIGDSLMAAIPAGPPGMLEIFAGLHTCRFSNKGVGGETTTQISARFNTDVVAQKPLYALIDGGINDLNGGATQATFLANWDSMLSACKTNGIRAIALLIFPSTAESNAGMTTRDTWNAALVSQTAGAAYASNTLILNMDSTIGQFRAGGTGGNLWDIQSVYNQDGTHLKPGGYAAVGQAINTQFNAAGLFMATSANTIWEVRGTVLNGSPGPGADTNGGGFVVGSGGTDFSQQNAAQVAVGGGSVTSSITTTVVTFTGGTYTVLAGDVGNIVQFISGTNVTAGFYQIMSVGAGLNGTWTLDRTPLTSGTTTNAVANMGGALGGSAVNSGLAKVAGTGTSAIIFSNKVFITGAFTSNATTTFASTGSPTAAAPPTRLIGYGVTRGDGVHATLALATNTGLSGLTLSGQAVWLENFDVDCTGLGTSTGITLSGTQTMARNCKVANFTTRGINGSGAQIVVTDCEVTGGTAAATDAIEITSAVVPVQRCFVHDNACPGIKFAGLNSAIFNVVANNTGASSDGFQCGSGCAVEHNTIHGNGRDGIRASSADRVFLPWRNNVITNNTGAGITATTSTAFPADPLYDGNAYFGNGSTRVNMDSTSGSYAATPYTNVRDVILSASPYVGGTTGTTANFALNNTAGGGAACRAAATPGPFPGNTGTTGYLDLGAVQTRGSNTSPSAGGSPGVIMATG